MSRGGHYPEAAILLTGFRRAPISLCGAGARLLAQSVGGMPGISRQAWGRANG